MKLLIKVFIIYLDKGNSNNLSGKAVYDALVSESLEVKTVSLEFKNALMKARQAKELT